MDGMSRGPKAFLVIGAWICLAGSLILLAYGATHSDRLAQRPLSADGMQRLAVVSGIYWTLVLLAMRWVGRSRLTWSIAAILLAIAASAQFAATVATLFLFASAWSVGDLAFGRVARLRDDAMGFIVRTACGLAILGWALNLLAPLPVNNAASYFILLVAPLWLDRRVLSSRLRGWHSTTLLNLTAAEAIGLCVLGNVLVISLLVTMLPEIGNDALSHHMAILAHVRDFGNWHFDVTRTLLAVMPLVGDFVYAPPFMFAGEFGAKLANLGCNFLLLALVYSWVRETASRGVALLCVLCVATIPLALLETASLFIENPWALFLATSIAVTARLTEGREVSTRVYPAALLCGAAVATKLMAVAAVPALVIAAAFALGRDSKRHLLLALALGVAVALPPYIVAFAKTGNPIFPFMNSVFRSPFYYATDIVTAWRGTLDPLFLYGATFDSPRYLETTHAGAIGFVPLLAFPLAVFCSLVAGPRRARVVVLAALSFALVVIATTAYLRYIYPAFFLMAMALGTALGELRERSRRIFTAACIVVTFGVAGSIPLLTSLMTGLKDLPVQAAFVERAKSEFIRDWAPHRAIVERINLEPLASGNVAFLGSPYVTGLQRPAFFNSLLSPIFSNTILSDPSAANVAKALGAREVGFAVVDPATPPMVARSIEELGTLVMEYGAARLYKLDDSAAYAREALRPLPSAPPDWGLYGHPTVTAEGDVTVTNTDYVGSRAPVSAQTRYRVDALARCGSPNAVLRLQISWLDSNDAILEIAYADKPCHHDWRTESAMFVSPQGSASAAVFVLGVDASSKVAVRNVALMHK